MRNFFANLKYGTRSLKSTLALYFIPISVIPALSISFYAFKLFEENTNQTLSRRASLERDALVAEVDGWENEILSQARLHAQNTRLLAAVGTRDVEKISDALQNLRSRLTVRIYGTTGNLISARKTEETAKRIDYMSVEGFKRVRAKGETLDRYFLSGSQGFVTVVRILLKDRFRWYGVLEEEIPFGAHELSDLKNRHQADVAFLSRDLNSVGASLALSGETIKQFSTRALQASLRSLKDPVFVELGENRFAAFLYDFPAQFGRNKNWGYVGIFLSMSSVDASLQKLRVAMLYLTLLLILTATLAIIVFSNQIVKPIVVLVSAMKRVKTGRVEQIPSIESSYEIEYLVRSFNEMARNVSAAKRALELKLEELRGANQEIKQTQSTLVQSAKMISLGQLVAGVAHELNNPIAFIYSNMHHLSEYVEKIKEVIQAYHEVIERLPPDQKERMEKLERDLELDYILKDMEELTRSCVEGANRTKEIVLGLRTFSRIDESVFRMADLHEGIRNTIKLLASEFKDRVRIHPEFGQIELVECNLSQMNQVFMNLLSNAAHAIEGSGDIWIRTRMQDDAVIIEIEDSGSGIPETMLEKIFDPFFTTKKVGQGTGLGLSIAYGLIQKHHGTISVRSELGRGTCFTIRLPVRQPGILTA